MKIRVAVLFGGKSVEHEVSVISGIQAVMAFDANKYEIIPVYISKNGEMYTGSECGKIESYRNIPALIKNSKRVILVNDNGHFFFVPYPAKLFSSKKDRIEVDVACPVVHGTNVEDGTLQGWLKTIGIPYTGCDVFASASGMDKYITKQILRDNAVPVLECLRFRSDVEESIIADKCEEKIGYPVIIKPVNLGSSVGIAFAKDREELVQYVADAFNYSNTIIVERAIKNLREINCSVLGDIYEAVASECEEPTHTDEILSYKDKYESGGKNAKGSKSSGSKGMASLSRTIPANISNELRDEIRELSVRAFKALGCCGVSRIDFLLDGETGDVWFNEINTIPGSLSFYLWEPVGVSYAELLDRMISLALKRSREEAKLSFSFDSNILAGAALTGAKGSGKV